MAGNSPWELTLHPPVQDGKQWGVGGCSTPCEWCIEEEQLPCTRQWGWMAPGQGGIRTIWSNGLLGQISSDCFTTSLEIPGTPIQKCYLNIAVCFTRNLQKLPIKHLVKHWKHSYPHSLQPFYTVKAQPFPVFVAVLCSPAGLNCTSCYPNIGRCYLEGHCNMPIERLYTVNPSYF